MRTTSATSSICREETCRRTKEQQNELVLSQRAVLKEEMKRECGTGRFAAAAAGRQRESQGDAVAAKSGREEGRRARAMQARTAA